MDAPEGLIHALGGFVEPFLACPAFPFGIFFFLLALPSRADDSKLLVTGQEIRDIEHVEFALASRDYPATLRSENPILVEIVEVIAVAVPLIELPVAAKIAIDEDVE